MGDLMAEVVKAYLGRVWLALGYESWADYIKGEFHHAPLYLPRDERQAVVALLRGQGMSTRAIAPAVGADQATVSRDLSGDANTSPDVQPNTSVIDAIATITGRDGKTYPSRPVTKARLLTPGEKQCKRLYEIANTLAAAAAIAKWNLIEPGLDEAVTETVAANTVGEILTASDTIQELMKLLYDRRGQR